MTHISISPGGTTLVTKGLTDCLVHVFLVEGSIAFLKTLAFASIVESMAITDNGLLYVSLRADTDVKCVEISQSEIRGSVGTGRSGATCIGANNRYVALASDCASGIVLYLRSSFHFTKCWSWKPYPAGSVRKVWLPTQDGPEVHMHCCPRDSYALIVVEGYGGKEDMREVCKGDIIDRYRDFVVANGEWLSVKNGTSTIFRRGTNVVIRDVKERLDYDSRQPVYSPSMDSVLLLHGFFQKVDIMPMDLGKPVQRWSVKELQRWSLLRAAWITAVVGSTLA
jgi:hypothetical protein